MSDLRVEVETDEGGRWRAWLIGVPIALIVGFLAGAVGMWGWMRPQDDLVSSRRQFHEEQADMAARVAEAEAGAAAAQRVAEAHREEADELADEVAVLEARLERPRDLEAQPQPLPPVILEKVPQVVEMRLFDLRAALEETRLYALDLEVIVEQKDGEILALRQALMAQSAAHESAVEALRIQTEARQAAEIRVEQYESAGRRRVFSIGGALGGLGLVVGLFIS